MKELWLMIPRSRLRSASETDYFTLNQSDWVKKDRLEEAYSESELYSSDCHERNDLISQFHLESNLSWLIGQRSDKFVSLSNEQGIFIVLKRGTNRPSEATGIGRYQELLRNDLEDYCRGYCSRYQRRKTGSTSKPMSDDSL